MTEARRLLFVDHTSTELGAPQFNTLELLGASRTRTRWETQVACASGSPLEAALAKLRIVRHAYRIPVNQDSGQKKTRVSAWARLRAKELQPATVRLHDIISGFCPDAVISCTPVDHLAAGPASERAKVPIIWWVNDILSGEYFSWPQRRLFRKRAIQWATRLVPVSEFARMALLKEGIAAERVATIKNGIELARFHRSSSTLLRDRLKLSPGEPLIGSLGRLTPENGQDFFLRLAQAWITQGRAGRFAVFGRPFPEDDAFEASLKKYVRKHRLSARVHFVALPADLATTLSQLDVLLHCRTKPEPSGRVILEAMAVGVPVIAARAGAVPEIITAGVNGGLADPGDLNSYTAELTALLGDRRKRAAWATEGRRTVASHFTIDRVLNDFEQVFEQITAK